MTREDAKPAGFDPMEVTKTTRRVYPPPHERTTDGRWRRALGTPRGLTQFGVNLTELEPGAVSALRHWHKNEDEFVYIIEGTPTLVTDAGTQLLRPGMCACFPANDGNGHRLENRSDALVRFLEVGTRSRQEEVHYPDSDMILEKSSDGEYRFRHFDGTPY